jgi:hypothetical protein
VYVKSRSRVPLSFQLSHNLANAKMEWPFKEIA